MRWLIPVLLALASPIAAQTAQSVLPGQPTGCTPRAELHGRDTAWAMVPCRSLDVLEPHFRGQLECTLDRMVRIGGWKRPLIAETYRSDELQMSYATRRPPVTKAKRGFLSVHYYAMAADVVHNPKQWDAPAGFWASLGLHAEECGLVAGTFWKAFPDNPHVQTGLWQGAPPAWARTVVQSKGLNAVWATLFPALSH